MSAREYLNETGLASLWAKIVNKINAMGDLCVKKAGDTMTGQLKTSFKSSVAMGSYGSSQTTIPNFINEIRMSSGCTGSVTIGTAFTKNGVTMLATWYNFIYSPHRSGGKNGAADGDNCNYGFLIMSTMTGSSYSTYIITISSNSSDNYIRDIRKVLTNSDGKCCKGGTLVITFNGSGYRDVAASSFGFSVKPNALVITPQSNSKAIISYDFDNSSDSIIRIYGYAINSSNQLYNLNGNVRIGWMSVDG